MWYDGLVGGVFNIFPHDYWWNADPSGCGSTPAYSHKPSGFYFYCYDTPGSPGVTIPQDLSDWVYYTEW